MDVGRRIQALRVKSGLSQEALAERLGVSRQSVSKWELEQALPDIEKIVQISRLFGVTTDFLLLEDKPVYAKPNKQKLHFGLYLIVKDFRKSVDFYEKLLCMRVSNLNPNRFAEFWFDGRCISIMNESNLPGHDYSGSGDHKFVFNFWINDLSAEYERVKSLNIGKTTVILHAHTDYYFFNIYDPDGNVIEITGKYEGGTLMSNATDIPICQSCEMPMGEPAQFGTNADGSQSNDYCCHCWKKGKFTSPKQTLEQAIEFNIPFVIKAGEAKTEDEARALLQESMPKLKRWATA